MPLSRRRIIVVVLTILLIASTASAAGKAPQGLNSFWTIDLEGKEVTQEIFSPYKLTLVNVWATFCSPCLQEMPDLAELRDEFATRGVNVIGIVTDVYHSDQTIFMRNLGTAAYIIEQTGADYTHLLPSQDLHNLRLKDVQVVPETFFVDSKGNIVGKTYYGARSKSAWKSIIESTLAQLD